MKSSMLASERGSVLAVSLTILFLLGLLGTTFLTITNTEVNIAKNQSLSVQALYVAEAGIEMVASEFSAVNFTGYTHNTDGTPATGNDLLTVTNLSAQLVYDDMSDNGLPEEQNDGWLVWTWEPGDPDSLSLSGTGLTEMVRVQLRPTGVTVTGTEYEILVEGSVGKAHRRVRVLGYTEPVFKYAVFSDGDLTDFTRVGQGQVVNGKVHANGDIYFRPWAGRTLTLTGNSITATGQIIRSRDNEDTPGYGNGSTVLIANAAGTNVEMVDGPGASGNAMDSENADWTNDDPSDGIDGALELWDEIVKDGALGAVHVDPPALETIQTGGWYDTRADIRIRDNDTQEDISGADITATLGGAIVEQTFYNPATLMYETVQEIDIDQLITDGNWPANGLIYSDVPIRVTESAELSGALTIVSSHEVYTMGDFNSVNKQPAAIVAGGRIYHVSDSWNDSDTYTQGNWWERPATSGTTTVNAALVDGKPSQDWAIWADLNNDGSPDLGGTTLPTIDSYLEDWGGGKTFRKFGSVVHFGGADMADNLDNSGILDSEIPWLRSFIYNAPIRDYEYDPSFSTSAGQPPFAPNVFAVYLWEEVSTF